MTVTETIARGRDTYASSATPKATRGDAKRLRVTSTDQAFVQFSKLENLVRGRTVVSATLRPRAAGAIAATTWTVALIAESWAAARLTWEKRPAVHANPVTATPGAVTDGASPAIDVTALVQRVAGGVRDYGFRVSVASAAGGRLASFENLDSWRLDVVMSSPADPPTDLVPAGGGATGTGKPTLGWTSAGDQASLQVQVNATQSATGAWDSGQVDTELAQLDLAGTTYPGAAQGATTYFRVRTRESGSDWSDWSDWVSWVYRPKPSLAITSPAGGSLSDTSPTIEGSVNTGTLVRYRVIVARASDPTAERYDSGRLDAAPGASGFSHAIPFRNTDGRVVFPHEGPWLIKTVVEDRADRVATPGDPATITATKTVTVVDVPASQIPAPTLLDAESDPTAPGVRLRVRRSEAPDAWLVTLNGAPVEIVEHDQAVPDGTGGWTITTRRVTPLLEATYRLKPVRDGDIGPASPPASITLAVDGVWLIDRHGAAVVLEGRSVSTAQRLDRRASYAPPALSHDIDVISSLGGLADTFTGVVDDTRADRDIEDALAVLEDIRQATGDVVTLVFGSHAIPVVLRDLTVVASDDITAHNRRHRVSFGWFQAGDFEELEL